MHYIMTCLSGDCVVLVTITVTTNLCTKEIAVRYVSDEIYHSHNDSIRGEGCVGYETDK